MPAFIHLQEVSRKSGNAAERPGEGGAKSGPANMSHWPLLQSIRNLDGFELAALLAWTFVLFLGIGFATDYVLGSRGVGPFRNAVYALLGGYVALCMHNWWLASFPAWEPEFTLYVVVTGLMTALVGANVIAMRR